MCEEDVMNGNSINGSMFSAPYMMTKEVGLLKFQLDGIQQTCCLRFHFKGQRKFSLFTLFKAIPASAQINSKRKDIVKN